MTTAKEIVTKPKQVFARFPLPINLREHLVRVAAVADTICKHWTGPPLNRDLVVAACLLHDIGNIMKMDFTSPWQRELMKDDYDQIPQYQAFQDRARAHYGNSPDDVRAGLLKQAAIEPEVQTFIAASEGVFMPRMQAENEYAAMVYLYANNRVLPMRVGTLGERIADAKERYPGYYDTPERKAIDYEQRLWEIETALQAHCSIPLNSITDSTIAKHPLWKAIR